MVVAIGIPLDENSSFLKGTAQAPQKIRDAYRSDSSNAFSEDGIDLGRSPLWRDEGNLTLGSMPDAFGAIEHAVKSRVINGQRVLSLGGDHSITYPIIKGFAARYSDLTVLHIDAHADLYHDFEGNRFSHACPFARIMEERLVKRLVQVGIRTLTTHQREQASRFNVEVIEMRRWRDDVSLKLNGPLYISLDMDALDPAFAPGVSHYEPGGFSTRQILNLIQQTKGILVGADLVEFNPERDVQGMTAMVAAKFYKELINAMM